MLLLALLCLSVSQSELENCWFFFSLNSFSIISRLMIWLWRAAYLHISACICTVSHCIFIQVNDVVKGLLRKVEHAFYAPLSLWLSADLPLPFYVVYKGVWKVSIHNLTIQRQEWSEWLALLLCAHISQVSDTHLSQITIWRHSNLILWGVYFLSCPWW